MWFIVILGIVLFVYVCVDIYIISFIKWYFDIFWFFLFCLILLIKCWLYYIIILLCSIELWFIFWKIFFFIIFWSFKVMFLIFKFFYKCFNNSVLKIFFMVIELKMFFISIIKIFIVVLKVLNCFFFRCEFFGVFCFV